MQGHSTSSVRKRIVFTTFGSLGDLHPYIAIALGLKARGHEAIIATSEAFRQRVESLGLGFRPVRPDHPDWQADPTVMRRVMTARKGTEYLLREMIMPVLRQSYDDTLAAAEGADLLVSHLITFTTRLVAEKKGLPWVSSVLQPLCFFSAYDPPVLALAPFLAKLRFPWPHFLPFPLLAGQEVCPLVDGALASAAGRDRAAADQRQSLVPGTFAVAGAGSIFLLVRCPTTGLALPDRHHWFPCF